MKPPAHLTPSEQLLHSARKGSRTSLGYLLQTFQTHLRNLVSYQLNKDLQSKASAGDLVQETFLEALTQFQSFNGNLEQFRHWLERILKHNVIDFARRFHTGKRDFAQECRLTPQIENLFFPQTPEEELAQAEQFQHLMGCLERLSAPEQQVIRLRYQQQLSFEEIARYLHMTPDCARKRFNRAVQRWRDLVGPLS